ncbi:hypothetical protein DL96DRAFT_1595782 [Flagelloscypha sp. PMI_526]|nr:hypothetical protein DL96DRAFT_1595782 [Flagelloscypha sp. PMI_526]
MAPSITYRVYQPRDQLNVTTLFLLTHYAGPIIFFGSLVAFISKSKTFKLIGVFVALLSVLAVVFYQRVVRKCFVQYTNYCLKTDMKDICKSYHLSRLEDESEEYAALGPSGFWVALTDTRKVVGCIGLEYNPDSSQQGLSRAGLLKRFCVDPTVRTLGIGKALFITLLEHAKRHESEVDLIELETTEYQAVAGGIYRRRGFRLEKQDFTQTQGFWGWVTFTLRIDTYRLWIRTSND